MTSFGTPRHGADLPRRSKSAASGVCWTSSGADGGAPSSVIMSSSVSLGQAFPEDQNVSAAAVPASWADHDPPAEAEVAADPIDALPVLRWSEVETALLAMAQTEERGLIVRYLLEGARRCADRLNGEDLVREIVAIARVAADPAASDAAAPRC
jgi:hypothetical protein